MYNPTRYNPDSDALVEEIVANFPFATLITNGFVSHVPLLLEKRGAEWILVGHFARANPHWKLLEKAPSLAIFHGPQAYITPLWYEQCDVPTWNYVVAHLEGGGKLLENQEDTEAALRKLSAKTEGPNGWAFEIPEDLAAPGVLMKSIVGFEINVRSRVAKCKLSQNKSSTDYQGILRGLSTRKDEQSHSVKAWMQRFAAQLFDKE